MAKGKNIHITHNTQDHTWNVKEEGASRPHSTHDTQRNAMNTGRDLARNNRSELIIHNRTNQFRDSDSYGNDPHPPKDTKH